MLSPATLVSTLVRRVSTYCAAAAFSSTAFSWTFSCSICFCRSWLDWALRAAGASMATRASAIREFMVGVSGVGCGGRGWRKRAWRSAAAGFGLRGVRGVVHEEGLHVLDLLGLHDRVDPLGALLVLAGGEIGLPLGLGLGQGGDLLGAAAGRVAGLAARLEEEFALGVAAALGSQRHRERGDHGEKLQGVPHG